MRLVPRLRRWALLVALGLTLGPGLALILSGCGSQDTPSPPGPPTPPQPAVQYNLSLTCEGQGTAEPAGTTKHDQGTVVTLTSTPAGHWTFDHWGGPDGASVQENKVVMDRDRSVAAVFVPLPALLNVTVRGQGTVEEAVVPVEASSTYPVGTTVRLTAKPADGWRFEQWTGDLTGGANPATLLVDAPKNVVAVFRLKEYAVRIRISPDAAAGSVAKYPDWPTYDHGSTVTLTATPAAGYRFDCWYGGGLEDSGNPADLVMDDNKDVWAIFVAEEPK